MYTIYTLLANMPWGAMKKRTNIGVTFLLVVVAILFNNFYKTTNIFVHVVAYSKGFSKWFPFYHSHIVVNLSFSKFFSFFLKRMFIVIVIVVAHKLLLFPAM